MVDHSQGSGRSPGRREKEKVEPPPETSSPSRPSKHALPSSQSSNNRNHEFLNGEARIIRNTPQFQQVTAFSQWCQPTRKSTASPGRLHPSDAAARQRTSLLRHYPDVLLADFDTIGLLTDEISASRQPAPPLPASTACLLATGEISEVSDVTAVKGHPVLAVVSGQLGDTLRIASLARESWTWTRETVAIKLNAPGLWFDKEWSQDRAPITCIKFALDLGRHDPIRWLIVQKASSTTIYEPELHPLSSEPPKLLANPLATIRRDQSGGSPQSDFIFISRSGEAPQLAIVDTSGYWCIWYVLGHKGTGRPRGLKLTMRLCGNIYLGPISQLPAKIEKGGDAHKLLLLYVRKDHSRALRRSRDGSVDSSQPEVRELPRPLLLMSNQTTVYQYDLKTGSLAPGLEGVLPKDVQILDIAKSNLEPSQAFILTRKNLLWIAAKETKSGRVLLDVLVSVPHRKGHGDAALRLETSPGTYVNDQKGCFVCVRSSEDTQMSIFWFIYSKTEPVQYRHQIVDLRVPSNFISMGMLPVRRANQAAGAGLASALAEARARFFQILVLSNELEVSSALCVWSDDPDLQVQPPDRRADGELVFKVASLSLDSDGGDGNVLRRPRDANGFFHLATDTPAKLKQQDLAPAPSTVVDLSLALATNRAGPWQGFEQGDDELDLKSGHHPLVDKLESMFGDLPRGNSGSSPQAAANLQSTLEAIAAQILHEELDVSALPQGPSGMILESQQPTQLSREASQDPFLLSSSLMPTIQSSQIQSSQLLPSSQIIDLTTNHGGEEEDDDPIVNHLRSYMHIDPMLPGESLPVLLGPFDWQVGGDPDKMAWHPGKESLDESLAKAVRRKKKLEKRMRRAEKLSARVFGGTGSGVGTGGEDSEYGGFGSSAGPGGRGRGAVSQPHVSLPRIMVSSQVAGRLDSGGMMGMSSQSMGPVFSSQVVGTGMGLSQSKSQVLSGRHGGRLGGKKTRGKKGSGFR